MSDLRWTRPKSVPYPTIWREFSKEDKYGNMQHFIIQDLTEDLFEPCIEHMKKYYLRDEPLMTALGLTVDQVSFDEQMQFWRKYLPQNLSLVCLVKRPPKEMSSDSQIVGMKLQFYRHKSDPSAKFKGEVFNATLTIKKYLHNQNNPYDLLKVDEYIDDCGLSTHPEYRQMGIATELLKAGFKAAETIGINTIILMLSAIGSQKAAEKTGYKTISEIKYSDLAKIFPTYKLNISKPPSIRYVYKIVGDGL